MFKNVDVISNIATPYLIFAAHHGTQEDILAALTAGANLAGSDSKGQTALHKAVISGNKEVLKLLLKKYAEAKIDIHIKDGGSHTPSDYADDTLAIYMLEQSGYYKHKVKSQEKILQLSNKKDSFIVSMGQVKDSTAAVNDTEELDQTKSNSLRG